LSEPPRGTDVVIRAARLEHVRRVLALWDQARSPAAVTPDDVRSVSRLIAHTDDALLVAEHDGQIVGALIAAWDGWRGNMYHLAVLPHLRRQGIATRLVEAGHEHLRGKGARRVTGWARVSKVPASIPEKRAFAPTPGELPQTSLLTGC
jgi:ribosomal protein S18 acetylase RimI-like enzyme